ncbi:hypothetical protein Hanom_Chr10g00967081 [Helianthus anomalus]
MKFHHTSTTCRNEVSKLEIRLMWKMIMAETNSDARSSRFLVQMTFFLFRRDDQKGPAYFLFNLISLILIFLITRLDPFQPFLLFSFACFDP